MKPAPRIWPTALAMVVAMLAVIHSCVTQPSQLELAARAATAEVAGRYPAAVARAEECEKWRAEQKPCPECPAPKPCPSCEAPPPCPVVSAAASVSPPPPKPAWAPRW